MKPPIGYADAVRRKAERMARARRRPLLGWRYLSSVGVLSWLFIVPVVLGVFAGRLVARSWHAPAATLIGLGAGLAAGSYLAFRHVKAALRDDDDSATSSEESSSSPAPPKEGKR